MQQRQTTNAPLRVLVVLSTIVVLIFLLANSVQAGSAEYELVDHKVTAGDTLWEIAGEYTTQEQSVWETVDRIKSANGLDGSMIRIGQTIQIPVVVP